MRKRMVKAGFILCAAAMLPAAAAEAKSKAEPVKIIPETSISKSYGCEALKIFGKISDKKASLPFADYSAYYLTAPYTDAKKVDLPEIRLDGSFSGMSKDDKKLLKFSCSVEGMNQQGYALTSWQGSSSLDYDKKNYSIKLYKDEDEENELKLTFGSWEKSENYVLKANWIDFTNARNIVAGRLYKRMPNTMLPNGSYGVPDGFPVRLYENGQDAGIYIMAQPKKKKLFGLRDEDAENGALFYAAEVKAGSVIFENSSAEDDNWELKFPDSVPDKSSLNRLTEFVSGSGYRDFKAHIEEYMDLDSLINYMVFAYISMNADGLLKNYNIVTFDGNLWYIRPYDLDQTFGLDDQGNADETMYDDSLEYWMNYTKLWNRMKVCFPKEIYNRYVEVRSHQLREEIVIGEFAAFMNEIGNENYQREFLRWYGRPGKQYALGQIRDYIYARYQFLDEYMEQTYNHESSILADGA